MKPDALILLAKKPDPRSTKTRLTPPLSREEATGLYACFLADTVELVRQVPHIARVLAHDPPEARDFFGRLAHDFMRLPQHGSGLGERMCQAVAAVLSQGYPRAVLVGSDLPHLPPAVIRQAFQRLQEGADLVLGPSADGGYYLIGLHQAHPQLFDFPMSTPAVLEETLTRAAELGLHTAMMPENFDVDTGADLDRLRQLLDREKNIPARRTRRWIETMFAGG